MIHPDYVDISGTPITIGSFYLDRSNQIFYVKGFESGMPLVESVRGLSRLGLTPSEARKLFKIEIPDFYIEGQQMELDWMKEKLNSLENKATQGAQLQRANPKDFSLIDWNVP
ncbi:MAG: hypothetical protein WC584_03935 [Candidatus Pacearchaeota archaeon]